VAVQLRVVPAQGEIILAVAPQVTGVPDGLKATLQTSTMTLRLQGELPLLRSLAPGALRATVNASGLNEGVHVLEATITAPEGVRVVSADPRQVVVVLSR
jgi:YbbR domain-containing protein